MAERFNRDPTYDLGRHIVTGEKGPLSGDPVIQKIDAELDRNDPMDPLTAGHGNNYPVPQSSSEVMAANARNAAGLQSVSTDYGRTPIDMAAASDCNDEPTKGGISYGPRNTGGY